MDVSVYLTFVIATALMISIPGPSVLLTVAHSVSFGWRHALFTVAGATLGVGLQLLIAIVGLASLLALAADVFEWIRWLGAAYLIYLGIQQWQRASEPLNLSHSEVSRVSLFVQGVIVTIPNPKSLIFIAAFLPQFIDPAQPLAAQLVLIVPTFLIIAFVVTSLWALAAGQARIFLQSQRAIRSVLRAAGGLMIAAGVGLALARRGS